MKLLQLNTGPGLMVILGQALMAAAFITVMLGCIALCIWMAKKIYKMLSNR